MWPFKRTPAPTQESTGDVRPERREPFISQFRYIDPTTQEAAPH